MTLTNSTKFNVQPIYGETDEVALAEPGSAEAEALEFTLDSAALADSPDWTYSATAEDAGTAGDLDGQPGLIYNGPSGNQVRVSIANFDTIEHAITPPEATDKAVMTVFKNSEVVDYADEGFSTHAGEAATEFNIDTLVAPVNEGDVIRVGLSFSGEEADADLDVAPGSINIT